jgi:dethiobiotin synthetase
MKPIAAGAETGGDGPFNADARALLEHSTPRLSYPDINPWLFACPTSPDIAARRAGVEITLPPIGAAFKKCCAAAEIVLVEGIGGWRVPLSNTLQSVDLVRHLNLPVILVCGIRLGCINHSLLTAECILADGIVLAGWIANVIDPIYEFRDDSIDSLRHRMPAPLIGYHAWHTGRAPGVIEHDADFGLSRLWP